ncbi:hypothetical protein OPV22_001791 [Ensete ventricosum]|uniref:GED domain-containing protein n=1 Tax=Ensete ventricosum TaxID=4639 RepID=A0AAV8RWJ0_ENSVE|nr:hypothetical protein OPV22_001791 [Ensete ventricosum]
MAWRTEYPKSPSIARLQGFGDDDDGELDRSGEPHPEGVHGAGRPLRRRRRHPADALGSAPPRCRRRRTEFGEIVGVGEHRWARFSAPWFWYRDEKALGDSLISLSIYSPFVVNLTLVHLPGLTKVAVGERTFGVLTKLDLIDKGTNALDVLEELTDFSILGRKEKEYFATSPEYSHLSSKMGSEYLAKLLSRHLESVIRAHIPSITSLINKTINELESEMNHLGRPIAVGAGVDIKEHLDGGRPGGDRIYGVFDNQLPAALKKLPLDRHLPLQNVRKVVSEADGYQPHLIAPEQGYRHLIESALNYFRGPAETSVDAVHFVLKELVRKSIGETQRFPNLQAEFAAASLEALERFRKDSRKTVLRLVDMEASYLTVDFFRKLPREVEKTGSPSAPTIDRYTDGHLRRIASNVWSYISMVSQTLKNSIPKAAVYCQVRVAKRSLLNHFYTQVGKKEGKQLSQLLDEDPALMERRLQCAKRLELYKNASDEIDDVSWAG